MPTCPDFFFLLRYFYMCSGDLNSGPHTCDEGTLLTELSLYLPPSPTIWSLPLPFCQNCSAFADRCTKQIVHKSPGFLFFTCTIPSLEAPDCLDGGGICDDVMMSCRHSHSIIVLFILDSSLMAKSKRAASKTAQWLKKGTYCQT